MGAVAVVGVYLVRTYKDARGRPRYIVDSAAGFEDRPKAMPAADAEKAMRARSRGETCAGSDPTSSSSRATAAWPSWNPSKA